MAARKEPQDGLDNQVQGSFQKQKLTDAMSNSNPAAPEHGGREAFSGQSKQLYSRRSSQQLNLQKEINGLEKEYGKKIREVHKTRCDIGDESKAGRKVDKTLKLPHDTDSSSSNLHGLSRSKTNRSNADNNVIHDKFMGDARLNREKYADHKRMKAVERLSRISRYRATSPEAMRGKGASVGTTSSSYGLSAAAPNGGRRSGKGEPTEKKHVFKRLSVDSSFHAMPSDLFLKQCQRKSMDSQKNRAISNRADFKH